MHDIVRDVSIASLVEAEMPLDLSADGTGQAMHRFISDMYPICRSITGDGVRKTIDLIREYIPLTTCEVPSGLKVFDWTIPHEWNVRDGYIKNSAGERVVDFRKSNLHLVNYSCPVKARMSLEELKPHLFSDPVRPDWIPYRTSYYKPTWGFCLSHNQLLALPEDDYEVCINSSLEPGHLTYGDLRLLGRSSEEVLISCHVCHPSLCNDNLSGIAVATALAQHLRNRDHRYTYRFIFVPGTIGSIAWLALNEAHVGRIKHGFVLTCAGDPGPVTYKKSRRGNTQIDKAWSYVLEQSGDPFEKFWNFRRSDMTRGNIARPVSIFRSGRSCGRHTESSRNITVRLTTWILSGPMHFAILLIRRSRPSMSSRIMTTISTRSHSASQNSEIMAYTARWAVSRRLIIKWPCYGC